jgi:phosphate transport system substrate-binding protein
MPRSGKLIRIALAVAAAAVVATLAAHGAGAASVKSTSTSISGAGSTFVAPLVNEWDGGGGAGPVKSKLGISLNYNPVGSGGGVQAIMTKQVDFGASDAPLSVYSPTCTSCVQIPWALAATAVISNLPQHTQFLHMTGSVLAQIYMGRITKWNAKAIKKLNPGVRLPNLKIVVVYRADKSGTSYNFTDYLSHVSHSWKSKVGTGTFVNWPVGVGYQHSSGVAGAVKGTPGAIGYVDVDYAVVNKLGYFKLKNRAGNYVVPKLKGIKAAAELDTHPAKNGSLSIVNPPKSRKYKNAYPISTYTYVDVQEHSANASALKKLIGWAVTKGDAKYGPKLFFAPLPRAVVKFDKKQLKKIHS